MPYASAEVRKCFAKNWGISIATSSPKHEQSNGQKWAYGSNFKKYAEKIGGPEHIPVAVPKHTRRGIVKLTSATTHEPYVERQTTVPSLNWLNPKIVRHARDQLVKRQKIQKTIYDKNAKDLSDLRQGDSVYFQQGKEWQPATVVGRSDQPQSYFVMCGGRQLRRNRRWLLPKDSIEYDTSTQEGTQNTPEVNPEIKSPTEHIEQTLDRSESPKQRIEEVPPPSSYTPQRGRTIKPPKFLDDYVP